MRASEVLWLKAWQEAVGTLRDYELEEGELVFEGFTVRLPPDMALKIADVESMRGRHVRILRTDFFQNPLIVMVEEEGTQDLIRDA